MVGKTVSHYKILEKLGGGGMGVVYKAQDLSLDRFVALKFLPPHLNKDEEEKKSFIREAKAASTLDHPNICTVHEIGETEEGQLFICMSHYDGETLKQKIGRGPLKIDKAIGIAIQVAQGLAKAHERGIIHRDIKPANIMITSDGVAKIVDFGLAKLAGQVKLTKPGTTKGTVAYMSPEQARGEVVDQRTDIWSLGVVLYEMLAGKLPFKGDYEQAVIYSIMNEAPELMAGLRPDIPMNLLRIVNKCLEKEHTDRYTHSDEIATDLIRLQQGVEVSREKPATTVSAKKLKNRFFNKTTISAGILLIIAMMAGIFLSDQIFKPGKPEIETIPQTEWENSIAVLPFANISSDLEQEYFCDGMTEQIISNLTQLQHLKVIARTSVMQFKDTEKTVPEIAKELNVTHVLEGSIRKSGDQIRVTAQLIRADNGFHLWAKDYDRELKDIFAVQDDVSESIGRTLLAELSSKEAEAVKTKQIKNVKAYEYCLKGEYIHQDYFGTSRKEDFRKAESMLKKALELDPNYAEAYAALADLYNTHYHKVAPGEEKKKYLRLQQQYIETAYQLAPNLAKVNIVKGIVHSATGETDKTYESYKRAGEINLNAPEYNTAMGEFFKSNGLYHQAIHYLTKAVTQDPLNPYSYGNLAWSHYLIGNFDQAKREIQKALEIHPDRIPALYLLINLSIHMKNYNEAEAIFERCEKINPDSPISPLYKRFRAYLYAINGEKEKAFSLWKDHLVYLLLGMKEEAIRCLKDESVQYLKLVHNPFYDSIRDDPRFIAIVEKQKQVYEEKLRKYGGSE